MYICKYFWDSFIEKGQVFFQVRIFISPHSINITDILQPLLLVQIFFSLNDKSEMNNYEYNLGEERVFSKKNQISQPNYVVMLIYLHIFFFFTAIKNKYHLTRLYLQIFNSNIFQNECLIRLNKKSKNKVNILVLYQTLKQIFIVLLIGK